MNIIDKFHYWRRKHRWNRQYRKGRWDNLKNEKESVRYLKIIEFIEKYGNKNPDILDLGCGEGILLDYLGTETISSFNGMDFSSVSIEKAIKKNIEKSTFICADLHNYKPTSNYDIVVLNEAFYYIHLTKRQEVINTIVKHLKPNGKIIVSIFREGSGCWEYFKNPKFKELEFVTVQSKEETYWKVGTYDIA